MNPTIENLITTYKKLIANTEWRIKWHEQRSSTNDDTRGDDMAEYHREKKADFEKILAHLEAGEKPTYCENCAYYTEENDEMVNECAKLNRVCFDCRRKLYCEHYKAKKA